MARTTIDGLAVRKSSSTKKVTTSSSHRVVGGSLADNPINRRTNTSKVTARKSTGTHTNARRVRPRNTDFLDPVRGFDYNSPDTSIGVPEESDWSDLLNSFGDDTPRKPKRTNASKDRSRKTRKSDLGLERDLVFDDEIFEEDPKKSKRGKKPKKKRKHHIIKKIFLGLFLLLIGGAVAIFIWGDSLISRLTNGQSGFWDTVGSLFSEEVPFETDSNVRTNIIIFCTEGYDMDGTSGDGVHDGAQLTDSIMVVSLDQKTQDVALLSLPRDLKVPMACSAGKINEVFWCKNQDGNNESAGAEALMKQAGEILGIDFQYWAHVNWGSVVEIVDSLGGITVVLDEDISDFYYTGMVIEAGVPTNLNGQQAVALARARHGTMGGDFTRGNSQQKIVEAIAQKLLENGISVSEALGLVNILGDNLRTNFTTDNIKAGVRLLSSFNINNIRNVSLVDYENNIYYVQSEMINGVSYVIPSAGLGDYGEIQEYLDRMFSSEAGVREGAEIAIYNASGQVGVAGAEKTHLESMRYHVGTVGDVAPESCLEEYCLYVLTEGMPATQAVLEDRYQTTARPANELPADVWPGNADFVVLIGNDKSNEL